MAIQLKNKVKEGHRALHIAAAIGNIEILEILKKLHVDIYSRDNSGLTALAYAKKYNQTKVIQWLNKQGLLVCSSTEAKDLRRTPLNFYAKIGNLERVTSLATRGYCLEKKDRKNYTPILQAASNGHLDILKFLKSSGANLFTVTNKSLNALHLACFQGHLKTIKWLIENGIPINSQSERGFTPLHCAALLGKLDVIHFLLSNKANPFIADSDTQFPYTLALKMAVPTHSQCLKLLPKNPLIEASIILKTIGHASSLLGRISLSSDLSMSFEFFGTSRFFYQKWAALLTDLSLSSSFDLSDLIELCSFTANYFSPKAALSRICSKKPLIIPLLSLDHAMALLFYENLMVLCDTCYFANPLSSITCFSIDSTKITEAILNNIFGETKTTSWLISYSTVTLPSLLSPLKTAIRLQVPDAILSSKKQKTANCTFASTKSVIRVALYYLGNDNAKKTSKYLSIKFLEQSLYEWQTLPQKNEIETDEIKTALNLATTKLGLKKLKLLPPLPQKTGAESLKRSRK